jgi:hypothetical protein
MELIPEVLSAMEHQGLRERLRQFATGGLTISQIFDRLPEPCRAELLQAHENPTVARRTALDEVVCAVFVHVDAGRVTRKRVHLKNATRAGIDAMVDVYRLR